MDLVVLVDSVVECPANNNLQLRKNKSIPLSIINYLQSIKKLLPNKLEKLSEEKPWNSIPIKEVIPINSKLSPMHTKFSPIQKKDNCTMNMEKKVYKTVVHQVELEDLEIFSASLEEEPKDQPVQEKLSQSLLKCKLLWMKFTTDVWRTLRLKGIETVSNAMERAESQFKNVRNVKAKEWFKNWSN